MSSKKQTVSRKPVNRRQKRKQAREEASLAMQINGPDPGPPPAKPWKKPVNVQTLLGERGQDINVPANSREALREQMVVTTMSQVLPVTCTVSQKTIANCALGIVLHALKHGLCSATDGAATDPYYMYRYLIDSFTSAMQGTIPAIQQAPVWYWELLYAIKKKQAPFKLSQVNYSWVFTPSSVADSSPIPMGVGPEAYSIVLTSAGTVNVVLGFPCLGVSGPYTPELGAAAIGNLWAYCTGSAAMTKLTGDPGERSYLYRDTSAMAVVYPELGGSFETPNALKATIYSERNIDCPLLSKFAAYQPEGTENWRGWHKAGVGGGTSALIGPTLMGMTDKEEIRGKVSPIVKFYNFDEFYEVLSLTLGSAASPNLSKGGGAVPQCPLSPIQVQILLRQTIIPLFSNEKCQDVRMSQSNSELFLPFSVGQNGVSLGTKMLLPTFLAENIRAAKSFSNRIRKKDPRTTLRVCSVLGRPSKPQLGNYTIGDTNQFLYTEDGQNQLVNLIDCSSIQSNQVLYLDLTREQIEVLESKWNAWIVLLSTNLSPLIQIGQTDGVSILKTPTLTNIQGQLSSPPVPPVSSATSAMVKQHSQSKIVKIPGLSREIVGVSAPVAGTGYFDKVSDNFTTSLQIVAAPVWKYLSLWILPVAMGTPSNIEELSIQGWSAFYIESYRIPRSTRGGQGGGVVGSALNTTTAYDRHVSMAQVDVKSIASDGQNELITELIKEGEKGRGSFLDALTSLVGPAINAFNLL